jgi:hypothetical protein
VHAHLMLEHEQRNDIAAAAQTAVAEQGIEVVEVPVAALRAAEPGGTRTAMFSNEPARRVLIALTAQRLRSVHAWEPTRQRDCSYP